MAVFFTNVASEVVFFVFLDDGRHGCEDGDVGDDDTSRASDGDCEAIAAWGPLVPEIDDDLEVE